jgi:hypothetical protein
MGMQGVAVTTVFTSVFTTGPMPAVIDVMGMQVFTSVFTTVFTTGPMPAVIDVMGMQGVACSGTGGLRLPILKPQAHILKRTFSHSQKSEILNSFFLTLSDILKTYLRFASIGRSLLPYNRSLLTHVRTSGMREH